MNNKVIVVICLLVLICASLSMCFGDENGDGGNGGGGGFKLYEGDDEFDWEDNTNSKPLTGLEVTDLAMDNLDIIAPNSKLVAMTSTSFNGQGADKTGCHRYLRGRDECRYARR